MKMEEQIVSKPSSHPAQVHEAISSTPSLTQDTRRELLDIIQNKRLSARFQPIIDLNRGGILGYEGLIRGPSDSILHSPIKLFQAAWENNLTVRVEHLCRRVVLEQFKALDLPGKLFLNVSPECLLQRDAKRGETLDYIHELGILPDRVIIELTEYQPTHDYVVLQEAVQHYRTMGFEIAIDDLGEGFSSLRLWSELKPEYVKIDMHFIQGIDKDPVKMQFVRSIQSIATQSATKVIAEGIETHGELIAVKELGVSCGQGYHIAKPHASPSKAISADVARSITQSGMRKPMMQSPQNGTSSTIRDLIKLPQTVNSQTLNNDVENLFLSDKQLKVIPIVNDGVPVGIINRHTMVDRFSRPFQRELYGKKPCSVFMDRDPVVVDHGTSLHQVSHVIVEADPDQLINGILITEEGRYIGMVTGPELMRTITQMQIEAARYANPLTQLPGNVPINQQIDLLLANQVSFAACYADLDHFKPFNDVYGYQRGDEVIQLTSAILREFCDPTNDFIGHIGGDDFIVLFQSGNWEDRCQRLLDRFEHLIGDFYSHEDREQGGYISEDRQGKKVFYPLISLSLGVIPVPPQRYQSHHEISVAAADAKKQAKKIHGNSLFIDRRKDSEKP
jgi:diguanylate cyclase (GGDEF)-like protein